MDITYNMGFWQDADYEFRSFLKEEVFNIIGLLGRDKPNSIAPINEMVEEFIAFIISYTTDNNPNRVLKRLGIEEMKDFILFIIKKERKTIYVFDY